MFHGEVIYSIRTSCAILGLLSVLAPMNFIGASDRQVSFESKADRLVISINAQQFAHYVFDDPKIPRPYFAHVKSRDGIQVSRNHPPSEGKDQTDHATMHPGIWLAFGDLDGTDFWRNKGKVAHREFLDKPDGGAGIGSFTEHKEYLREDGSLICQEVFRCRVVTTDEADIIEFDSTFSSAKDFYFGDQEEMGLGIRLATPIAEVNGGQLRDSEGRITAKSIWSHSSDWCDYSGMIDGKRVGMAILCHPENPRPSWMHARNYGFVAANLFGQKAMKKGPASKLQVADVEEFRLRYAVAVYSSDEDSMIGVSRIYEEYTMRNRESH